MLRFIIRDLNKYCVFIEPNPSLFIFLVVNNYISLLCHCVPPQRKRLSSNKQKKTNSEIGKARPVVFIRDERKKRLTYKQYSSGGEKAN